MNLVTVLFVRYMDCIPRVSGGEPDKMMVESIFTEYSPRERG